MKKVGNILWGIVFIAIGVIWAINASGIAHINIFFRGWWTLFIIIPCSIGIVKDDDKTGNIIGLLIGVALLLAACGLISFETIFKLMLPTILILIGLSIIFRDVISNKISSRIKELNKDGLEEYYATFAGQKVNLANEEFKGCSLNAVFGGVELDLRDSIINSDQIINASAIFGGVEIAVPSNVNIKVKSTPIFGGVSDKTRKIKGENIPTIYLNAFCLFGGVDIK